jgi:hypothetical protein
MIRGQLAMRDVQHLDKLRPGISSKLWPAIRSDRFGHPKAGYPKNINARAHATAEISDQGTASIHLDVQSKTMKT